MAGGNLLARTKILERIFLLMSGKRCRDTGRDIANRVRANSRVPNVCTPTQVQKKEGDCLVLGSIGDGSIVWGCRIQEQLPRSRLAKPSPEDRHCSIEIVWDGLDTCKQFGVYFLSIVLLLLAADLTTLGEWAVTIFP
jgi:hypothetical protein